VGDNSHPDTSRTPMKKLLNTVYWIGVAVSLALISFGVWCHFIMDTIVRIPFVFLPVGAGLMIGLYCVEHLLRQRR
jgi:ABC-type sulfate transport system permease subunit